MEHIKKVCALGFGAALSAIIITLWHQKQQNKNNRIEQIKAKQQQRLNKQQLADMQLLRENLLRKKQYFEIQYQTTAQEHLTKQCIFNFIKNSADLINQKQYQSLYEENRVARRKVFANITNKYEVYFRFVCTLDENIKYLIERTQKDVAVFLDLDFNKIVQSIQFHIEQQQFNKCFDFRESIIELTSGIRDQISYSLPLYKSPVDKNKLLAILNFEISILTQQSQLLLSLIDKIGLVNRDEEQAVPLFLNFFIEDSIYSQFGVQTEQMTMEDTQNGDQLIQKFSQITLLKEQLIRKMHQIVQEGFISSSNQGQQGYQ